MMILPDSSYTNPALLGCRGLPKSPEAMYQRSTFPLPLSCASYSSPEVMEKEAQAWLISLSTSIAR